MSDITVTTEWVMATDQADKAVGAMVARMIAASKRIGDIKVEIAPTLRMPDTAAIDKMLERLRATPVEIPVRFATGATGGGVAGEAWTSPRVNPSPATGSAAVQNGRPGVSPGGLASMSYAELGGMFGIELESPRRAASGKSPGQIEVEATGQGPVTERLIASLDRLETTMRTARPSSAASGASAAASSAPTGAGWPGNVVPSWAQAGSGSSATQTPPRMYSLAQRQMLVSSRDPATQAARDQQAADLRMQRQAAFNQYVNSGGASGSNGMGYNGGTAIAAAPTGTSAGSTSAGGYAIPSRHSLSSLFRTHPALGRMIGVAGGVYALDQAMSAAVSIGNAGYGMSKNERFWEQNNALQQAFRLPIASTAGDFIDASLNKWGGRGFVTDQTLGEYTYRQAQLQDALSSSTIGANTAKLTAGNFDPRQVMDINRRNALAQAQVEANANYRDMDGRMTANGETFLANQRKAVDYNTWRQTYEYNMAQWSANATSGVENAATYRMAGAAGLVANKQYDRNAQLNEAMASIDVGVNKEKAALPFIVNPDERKRAEEKLTADTELAKQDKIKQTFLLKQQWANEDERVAATIDANVLRVSGNAYDADVMAFKAAWDEKINIEQDAAKKLQLTRQRDSEIQARDYQLSSEARQRTNAAASQEMANGGNAYGATIKRINDTTKERGRALGIYDPTNDRWYDTKGINPATGRPFTQGQQDEADSLDREKRAQLQSQQQGRFWRLSETATAAQQANLRATGQYKRADVLGLKQQAEEEISSVRNDPELLKATIAKYKGLSREMMMGDQHSEMFGSYAQYATSTLMKAMDDNGGAGKDLMNFNKELDDASKKLGIGASDLMDVAKIFKDSIAVLK